MIPTNSSITTNGCNNISSNCVIWQGPDIACIELCTGDTISEVTKKIGDKVCKIITDGVSANPSLTGLDLSCLNIQGTTPTTLVPVLQAMVTQICANSISSLGPSTPLPMMTLPACLKYNDASGNPVTELRLDAFALLIANQVCTNLASITTINTTLTSLDTRIDVLEACVLPCSGAITEVQIVPTCVTSTIGQLTNVSVVVTALESAFCALQTAVGTPSAISSAIAQTVITGSYLTLTNSAVSYGSIAGYNNSPSNLAQSVQNAWVVIDDLYTAVAAIQTNCCPGACDAIVYNYTTSKSLAANGTINGILFNFTGSSIPATYSDSSGFSNITITDSLGSSLTTTVSISSLQNNAGGYLFSTGSLNTSGNINIAVSYSFTDGVNTCQNDQSSVVGGIVPCPAVVVSAITSTQATVTLTNTLGTTATYIVDILDGAVVVATTTLTNPTPTPSHTFTGLTPGTSYDVRITNTFGGVVEVCTAKTNFKTTSAAAACDDGMDVAFIMDYSGSMGTSINALKTGFASLITTIQNQVSAGNEYRISITTADEDNFGVTPNYNACTEYTSLPAAQRLNYPGNSGHQLFISAWEMFQTNNATTATTQLNLLNSPGGVGTCVQIGYGGSTGPECTDQAINRVLNNNFTGIWRVGVARFIIVGTDVLPGGDDGKFDANDWTFIQTLATQALTQGVKIFILGPGVDAGYTPPGGSLVYPWRYLATTTGGNYNNTFDAANIQAEITSAC